MVNVLFFGQLTELLQVQHLSVYNVADTASLQAQLAERFPALQHTKYMLALDMQTIVENTVLKDGSTVAFMPPFSGG